MGFDQKGPVTLYVKQGRDSRWQVTEEGFERPLAFFSEKEVAIKYANEIVGTKKGSKVTIED